jgi:hypothetical protein
VGLEKIGTMVDAAFTLVTTLSELEVLIFSIKTRHVLPLNYRKYTTKTTCPMKHSEKAWIKIRTDLVPSY